MSLQGHSRAILGPPETPNCANMSLCSVITHYLTSISHLMEPTCHMNPFSYIYYSPPQTVPVCQSLSVISTSLVTSWRTLGAGSSISTIIPIEIYHGFNDKCKITIFKSFCLALLEIHPRAILPLWKMAFCGPKSHFETLKVKCLFFMLFPSVWCTLTFASF